MKKILFIVALSLLVALPSVNAQDKKSVKVKVEKKINDEDGKGETKVVIIKDGEVLIEKSGEDLDMNQILAEAGLSEEEIENIDISVNKGVSGKKMIWVSKDANHGEMNIEKDANVFVIKDENGNVSKRVVGSPHGSAMFFSEKGGEVGVYDYSKSDEETKAFDIKQKKEIEFSSIYISSMGPGLKLSFECPKNDLVVRLVDSKGKKLFFEKESDFEGKYSTFIPVSGEKGSVLLLEVKSGDRNWIQKIKVE